MDSPIKLMQTAQYYRDGRPWTPDDYESPTWEQVEQAIRRMDDYCFPFVTLNPTGYEDEDDQLWIVGGDGRWTLFQSMGEWWYENPAGTDEDITLWQSDQGCYCKQKNLIHDVEQVIRFAKVYYETASFEAMSKLLPSA